MGNLLFTQIPKDTSTHTPFVQKDKPGKYEPYSLEYYEAKKRWESFQKIQKYKKQNIKYKEETQKLKKLSCT